MRFSAILFSFVPTLLAAAQPAATPAPPQTLEIHFTSGQSARRIPIELAGGLIFVQARVADTPLWFFLNTASASAFGQKQAQRLGLTIEEDATGAPQGKKPAGKKLRDLRLSLPDLTLREPVVACFDLDGLQTAVGHKVDGVLGSALIERAVVEIDYRRRTMSLHDPASYRYSGPGSAVPMELDDGKPYVPAKVALRGRAALSGQFLVDTGAESAIRLFSPFVQKYGLLGPPPQTPTPQPTPPGDEGTIEGIVRAEKLELAGSVLREPIVFLSRATDGAFSDSEHAGSIGGEVLSRFKAILDVARRRLILEKGAHLADPFDYDASGVSLTPQGPDLTTFVVRRVLPDSPAAQAGLQVGDVLLAIDDRPAMLITLRGIRRLFRQDGKEFVLSLLRKGEFVKLRLKCKRRI